MNVEFKLGIIEKCGTATKLALDTGLTEQAISHLVRGYRRPRRAERAKLLTVFNAYQLRKFFPRKPRCRLRALRLLIVNKKIGESARWTTPSAFKNRRRLPDDDKKRSQRMKPLSEAASKGKPKSKTPASFLSTFRSIKPEGTG